MITLDREEISPDRAAAINVLVDKFTKLTSAMLDDDGSTPTPHDALNDISVAMMYSLAQFTAFEFKARAPNKHLNDNESRMFVAVRKAQLFNEIVIECLTGLGELTPNE